MQKKLSVVKSKGFKDAYIVAFQDGEIIPINSAIRQETVQVPMEVTEEKKEGKATGDQNLGIIYVIQGEVSLENEQLIDEIREVLDEGLDLFVKKNTNTLKYIINSFKTYDDALKIKTQLESIVKKDVEVHAYFAENQIPIEQARKITK